MILPKRPALLSFWDLLGLLGFAALWGFYNWILPSLPDPVPTHFNAAGIANGFTAKADLPWGLFGVPMVIWVLTTAAAMLVSLLREDPARARAAAMQPLRGLLGVGLALLMGSSLLAPHYGPRAVLIGLAGMFSLIILGIVFMVREVARTPDGAFIKWGIFYCNPDDPRTLVEKRIGVGWTLNFAHPASWLYLLLMLLLVGVGLWVAKGMQK